MISVVIITYNAAATIGKVLNSLKGLTEDIIIVDSESTDGTSDICKSFGASVIENEWLGYGHAKNKGNKAARHDWILSLDADEVPDEKLKNAILGIDQSDLYKVYRIRRISFFCEKKIRFGVWSNDRPMRFFNRTVAEWNLAEVHENLQFSSPVQTVSLKGELSHFTADDAERYRKKMKKYAQLNAEKYFRSGRKVHWVKIILSPVFGFIRYYIFELGFLDGWEGYQVCLIHARYTYDKYVLLKQLKKK